MLFVTHHNCSTNIQQVKVITAHQLSLLFMVTLNGWVRFMRSMTLNMTLTNIPVILIYGNNDSDDLCQF